MFCPHCGYQNGDASEFCSNCGTRLSRRAESGAAESEATASNEEDSAKGSDAIRAAGNAISSFGNRVAKYAESDTVKRVSKKSAELADTAKRHAQEATKQASEAVSDFAESEQVRQFGERAAQAARTVRDEAKRTGETVSGKVVEFAESDQAKEVSARTAQTAKNVGTAIRSNKKVAGIVAAAVAAVVVVVLVGSLVAGLGKGASDGKAGGNATNGAASTGELDEAVIQAYEQALKQRPYDEFITDIAVEMPELSDPAIKQVVTPNVYHELIALDLYSKMAEQANKSASDAEQMKKELLTQVEDDLQALVEDLPAETVVIRDLKVTPMDSTGGVDGYTIGPYSYYLVTGTAVNTGDLPIAAAQLSVQGDVYHPTTDKFGETVSDSDRWSVHGIDVWGACKSVSAGLKASISGQRDSSDLIEGDGTFGTLQFVDLTAHEERPFSFAFGIEAKGGEGKQLASTKSKTPDFYLKSLTITPASVRVESTTRDTALRKELGDVGVELTPGVTSYSLAHDQCALDVKSVKINDGGHPTISGVVTNNTGLYIESASFDVVQLCEGMSPNNDNLPIDRLFHFTVRVEALAPGKTAEFTENGWMQAIGENDPTYDKLYGKIKSGTYDPAKLGFSYNAKTVDIEIKESTNIDKGVLPSEWTEWSKGNHQRIADKRAVTELFRNLVGLWTEWYERDPEGCTRACVNAVANGAPQFIDSMTKGVDDFFDESFNVPDQRGTITDSQGHSYSVNVYNTK